MYGLNREFLQADSNSREMCSELSVFVMIITFKIHKFLSTCNRILSILKAYHQSEYNFPSFLKGTDINCFPPFFGRACISRFQDCPLCGLDIDGIEADPDMQGLVDRFIDGHARIRRPTPESGAEVAPAGNFKYEDISVERGSFLVQQAMRVSTMFPKFRFVLISRP